MLVSHARRVPIWLALAALAALAQGCATHNTVSDGDDARLMLGGNDPVAYFTEGRPVAGRPDIKAEHDGVTYRFASAANRERFAAEPGRYAPQYGGFCSNGAVYGIPLASATHAFKIVDGRLFLFGGAGSKKYWEMDERRNVELGDHYWRTEMQGRPARLQAWKRLLFRVPHYRTNRQLAAEWEARQARAAQPAR
jgi:YHS domain-containing protein